jgi:signal peptidase I
MSPLPPFTSRPQRVLRWLWPLLGLALVVRHWIWVPLLIQGTSMVPTLRGGQLAGINELAYAFRRPARGDIVAVWTGKELMIKRVVGLPGEELCVDKGVLCVNGAPLPEPYVKFCDFRQNIAAGRIEADCFVVAGDNRAESVIAVVSSKRIKGRIVVPWKRLDSIFHGTEWVQTGASTPCRAVLRFTPKPVPKGCG